MSPPSRIAIASPIAGLPLTWKSGSGGSEKPRRTCGDVAQRHEAVADDEVDRLDVVLGVEGARHAQEDPLVAGLQDAGGPDQVLRLQLREQGRVGEAEAGEPRGGELEEDLLVLGAEDLDLRDVGHREQARARVLDVVAQLAVREPVGGEAVDDAVGVAEVVVEAGADRRPAAGCRGCRRRSCAPATRCPRTSSGGVDCFRSTNMVVTPGGRVAAHPVEMARLLELALDPLGDLEQRLLERWRRARPRRRSWSGT